MLVAYVVTLIIFAIGITVYIKLYNPERIVLQRRLKIYKKAFYDFKNAKKYTDDGFCIYFSSTYSKGWRQYIHLYPELMQTKPPTKYMGGNYWFMRGERQPRIDCLERAIADTEIKIRIINYKN